MLIEFPFSGEGGSEKNKAVPNNIFVSRKVDIGKRTRQPGRNDRNALFFYFAKSLKNLPAALL